MKTSEVVTLTSFTALNAAPSAGVSARLDVDVCVLTIVIPCLNEAETIGTCVSKQRPFWPTPA
jgi:hypothetical protein